MIRVWIIPKGILNSWTITKDWKRRYGEKFGDCLETS